MFFEPPKVKSLSRYAEYGAYPGNRYFLIALAVAITAHFAIIAIYSMLPTDEVIKIPVRVLNIKLSGGSAANGISMPKPSAMPNTQPAEQDAGPKEDEEMKKIGEDMTEPVVSIPVAKPHEKKPAAAQTKSHVPIVPLKTAHGTRETKKQTRAHTSEFSLATPKKYVREGDTGKATPAAKPQPATAGTGNGSGVAGDAGGTEIINRYTQTVSQWIKNHQDYARAAYKEAMEGQGSMQGQTVIRLRINRDGHIIYNSVDRSSGSELVDQVAIAMVRASDPVPAVPTDYPSDSQLEFLIAVQVDLTKK